VVRIGYSNDMGWHPVSDLWQVFPRDLWPMMVLARPGGLGGGPADDGGPALALIVFPLAGFFIIRYADWTKLYNARLLPYWYYAVFLFAGLFVGWPHGVGAAPAAAAGAVWGTAVPAAVIFLVIAAVGIQKTPSWRSGTTPATRARRRTLNTGRCSNWWTPSRPVGSCGKPITT